MFGMSGMFGVKRARVPETGPFYQQRGWVSAALFMAFLLVMALIAVVSDDGGESLAANSREALADAQGPLSPGDPQHVRTGPSGRPDNCRTDDRDTAVPDRAPKDVGWKLMVAVMVPVSPVAGPLNLDPAMWWCFAHTPLGAVMAAHTIPVSISGADWRTVAAQQVVPDAARDRFVNRKTASGSAESPADAAVGRFVGFLVPRYDGTTATVRLLLTNPIGGYLSTSMNLRWQDGDWKVALQNDGSLYSATAQAEPNGFVMWGA